LAMVLLRMGVALMVLVLVVVMVLVCSVVQFPQPVDMKDGLHGVALALHYMQSLALKLHYVCTVILALQVHMMVVGMEVWPSWQQVVHHHVHHHKHQLCQAPRTLLFHKYGT
jgi:hypothetical protein